MPVRNRLIASAMMVVGVGLLVFAGLSVRAGLAL